MNSFWETNFSSLGKDPLESTVSFFHVNGPFFPNLRFKKTYKCSEIIKFFGSQIVHPILYQYSIAGLYCKQWRSIYLSNFSFDTINFLNSKPVFKNNKALVHGNTCSTCPTKWRILSLVFHHILICTVKYRDNF